MLKSILRYGIVTLAIAVAASAGTSVAGQDASGRPVDEIPLSEQLEGLGPVPRLAYLRHLMKEGHCGTDVLFQTAVAFHEMDQADSAQYYYERVIGIDPGHFKAHVNMGVLLDDRGDYAGAVRSFETAVAINPEDVLANSHLAFLLHQNGDYKSAWDHLEKALSIAPDHPQPRFYLAIFFWDAKIYNEAMREWERVIEIEPDGFLAARARENIIMLQQALNSPSEDVERGPER